jgi:dTDP-glucose 4,6-dehydratase
LRVAVLGASSFAGSDFIDLLFRSGDHDVLALSRSAEQPAARGSGPRPRDRFVYRRLDLNHDAKAIAAALDAYRPDSIVNFAAQGELAASWAYPQDFFRTNCVALSALVEHLNGQTYLRRFLHVSTSSVYAAAEGAHSERSPVSPGTPYGVSKAAFDHLLSAYHRNFGFPAQIVRPPNLYGPYQQTFRIIPKAAILLKRGERIELHGGGRALKQYLHVRDASRAIRSVLEHAPSGEIYNIAPDDVVSIREIVALACERLGKEFDACTREVEDRRGQHSGVRIDSTKISRELGWHPQIPLRTGVHDVLDWVERDWPHLAEQSLVYTHRP